MAHELCHVLHDAGEGDLETRLSIDGLEDRVEQRARAFAPAFLAPRDEVRHWFQSGEGKGLHDPEKKVLALARRWGLSWEGATWHAKNCRLISPATAHQMSKIPPATRDWQEDFEPATGETTPFPEDMQVTRLCRGRIATLVAEVLKLGVISEGRAREILAQCMP